MKTEQAQTFNKIYVVDSLRDTELQTAAALFHDNIQWRTKHLGLDSSYTSVSTRQDFSVFWETVRNEVLNRQILPIIHLEAHGDENGLALRSGEQVKWEDLIENLCVINRGCGNNLLLTLAVCKGVHLMKIIVQTITGRTPFWAIIGPTDTVKAGDISKAFNEFYGELLSSLDGTKALNKLNDALPPDATKYRFVYCEALFRMAFKGYLNTQCSGKTKRERVERLLTEIKTKKKLPAPIGEIRHDFKEKLRKENQRPIFEKYRRRFFMIDDFPENDKRFPVRFEEFL